MTKINRRSFLRTSAAVSMLPLISPTARVLGANERLRIAVVGVGGRGAANIEGVQNIADIVALCDVDANRLAGAASQFTRAAKYADYRRMLDNAGDFDAVMVSTPDHVHAPASVAAMQAGKHVYCEKPLAHSVYATRTMTNLARQQGLVTQMGTQIHAGANYRRVVELIRGGAIGTVREAHVWCGKSWSNGRFKRGTAAPDHLDWNLWLGPAPEQPYSANVHPGNWRRFWDFGSGTLGDMACHYMDLVYWALDLKAPTKIRALGPKRHEVGTPDSLVVHYEHAATTDRPPIKVTWSDGQNRPTILSALRRADGSQLRWGDGQLFVGDKGMLLSDYSRHVLLPEETFADYTPPARSIPDSVGHHKEWVDACTQGSPTTCSFDYSGPLTEAVLLGNVAFRVGKTMEWNSKTLTVTNAPEAEELIRPAMRDGWAV